MNTINEVASQSFRVDESNNISTKVDLRKVNRAANFYESGDSSIGISTRHGLSPKPTNISELDKFKKASLSNK